MARPGLNHNQVSLLYDIADLGTDKSKTHPLWWRTFDQLERRGLIELHGENYCLTEQGREELLKRGWTPREPLYESWQP